MPTLIVIIIGISLSMDAFSLALAYGTCNLSKKNINLLSVIVGIYHFFMPLIGMYVGRKIIHLLPISPDVLVFLVLLLIGIEMIIESFKEEDSTRSLTKFEMLMFGFAVSIDSFSVGIGLQAIYKYPVIAALIFSFVSFIFTNIGLRIGTRINLKIGKISTFFGGLTLIILGIIFLM